MARIFVSYSRKNKDFCRQLTTELQKRDFDFWVDWEGIPPTVDWKKEIQKGIEEADTFLAIVSPDWISSQICIYELDIAVKNGKRLIPVVPCDIVWDSVPATIAHINFIFFTEADDFHEQFNNLCIALDADYDWQKKHRRLQVKALDWERSNKENGFLLHGKDLEEAETQISVNANKDPRPTDLQHEYVLKSRQEASSQRRRVTSIMALAIVLLAGITAYLGIPRLLNGIAQIQARGEMVPIPAGPAIFGTENPTYQDLNRFPPREEIPNLPAFEIGKYEVSNYQYGKCVKYGPCTVPAKPTDFDALKEYPVVNVTLFQASTYCQWLGQRLPNQYEWERAARGATQLNYNWPWGNDDPSSETANMPWGSYVPKELDKVNSHTAGKSDEGVYNLVGNVWEWSSSYADKISPYDPSQVWNEKNDQYDGTMIYSQNGGSWKVNVEELAIFNADFGTAAYDDVGFRCAADAE